MTIRFKIKGVDFEVDLTAEAVAVVNAFQGEKTAICEGKPMAVVKSKTKKTAKGKRNGRYCLECDKPLTGQQKFFCTTGHAGRYYTYHKGEVLTPLTKPRNGPVTVVAGVGVRDADKAKV